MEKVFYQYTRLNIQKQRHIIYQYHGSPQTPIPIHIVRSGSTFLRIRNKQLPALLHEITSDNRNKYITSQSAFYLSVLVQPHSAAYLFVQVLVTSIAAFLFLGSRNDTLAVSLANY